MKKLIAVICADGYVYQKIYLILKGQHSVYRADEKSAEDAEIVITDNISYRRDDARIITVGRGEDSMLGIPFDEKSLLALISGESECALRLGNKSAYLRGERIKLTEVEHSLLAELIEAGGEYVERDALISRVWGAGVDGGVLNVYVHYLREKLEACGEKIIISSRKLGYKIDEKYLVGGEN